MHGDDTKLQVPEEKEIMPVQQSAIEPLGLNS